ncbi:catechol 2,3-dioxygenase-like lactoylglutathione lyase family enzyme [Nocardioides luteus]|uniref:Glyoxalase n=1 Tax=Nocardioides luteus TaxID=1844 RepID=A0ABQ5SPB1_9ACTN|nr:VOC family protein [Nocardioides luteus]MDR7312916.1 catechol 2,3-dioxygenase-like lactoylglutathione lyase family enzyme [Nocardioides luteus]GGR45390.1 glyoxalase [Nocardioides luteus]GLJ65977.1 glyoxalase [Nocardioides luteus]
MLTDSRVMANIPAADLGRARRFYADTLGLEPTEENPGGLLYTTKGGTSFHLYETEYAGRAGHTIAQFHVDDVRKEVDDLAAKGVSFEHFEMPGMTWDGDVAALGESGHAAWFKDSEDNVLCIDDMAPA